MPEFKQQLAAASAYLAHRDYVLAPIITQSGLPKLKPHKNYYWALVDSIISQQLSVKAAHTIESRFRALYPEAFPQPASILKTDIEELRSVGLSQAKANYIHDLAAHIVDGRLRFDQFDRQSDTAIIAKLTDVKGIGEWTAHMFLIFCMGRLDVLAVGDLGIRKGIQLLYNLKVLPSTSEVQALAKTRAWHPYASVACWYIWAALDNKPNV